MTIQRKAPATVAAVRDELERDLYAVPAGTRAREARFRGQLGWTRVFESLSDRLTGALQGLRGKGRLTDADIDATAREIRLALLEADVSLPVVRDFVARIKDRAKGAEVSGALNPAQQVVKIVNDELIAILGGETRQLAFAKTPPTVIMLAGLQGSGKTTLAGKLAKWLRGPRTHAAAGGVRPAAARCGQPAADRRRTRRCRRLRPASRGVAEGSRATRPG